MRASLPWLSTWAALFVAIAVAGCGDGGTSGSGGGGEGGAGGSGAAGGSGGGDPCAGKACGDECVDCPDDGACAPTACDASGACVPAEQAVCSAVCPATQPADGAPCPQVGLACENDEGVVLACRSRTQCTPNGWLTVEPGCSSEPPVNRSCPATEPAGTCDVAADPSLCQYSDSVCGCSDCLGGPCGGQAEWVCADPPEPPCPALAPKLGAPCSEAGLSCVYGACALGGTSGGRTCFEGHWVEDIVPCPQ